MKQDTTKQILISILVGACVAFLSSLLDGIIWLLQNYGNNIAGAITASVTYTVKNLRV